MKKIVYLIALLAVCLIFSACNNNDNEDLNPNGSGSNINNEMNSGEQQNTPNEYVEPVKEDFDVNKAMTEMRALIKGDSLVTLSEEEINNRYDFGDYKDLEKIIATNENENGVNEIAIVKLDTTENASDILLIMMDRIFALKEKYADNEEVTTLLNTEGKFIVKEQGGIAVMIIADNAQEIEAKFDENLNL